MSCPDCSAATGFPNTCGQVVVVNYRPPEASSAIPAWLEYNCDGEVPELILYSTPDLEETIDDWDIDYIELIGKGVSGTSCADSTKVDLCPSTLGTIHDMFMEQTTAINNNIDEAIEGQTTDLEAAISSATNNIISSIATASVGYESDGVTPLPPGFKSLPASYTWDEGNLTEIEVADGVNTWITTNTYDLDGNILTSSGWVRQ